MRTLILFFTCFLSLSCWARMEVIGTCITQEIMVIISKENQEFYFEIIGEDGDYIAINHEGEQVSLNAKAQLLLIQEGIYEGYFRFDYLHPLDMNKNDLLPMWSFYVFEVTDEYGETYDKGFFDTQQIYPTSKVFSCSPHLTAILSGDEIPLRM